MELSWQSVYHHNYLTKRAHYLFVPKKRDVARHLIEACDRILEKS